MPVVRPSNTPDRISTVSGSRRCVTCRDVPGLRRSSSRWMSASASASPGGQPSTTQPIAGPCDSPNDVTQNSVPSVLPDIGADREWKRASSTQRAKLSHRTSHANDPRDGDASTMLPSDADRARCGSLRRAMRRGTDRRRRLGGIRRADVSRRADRAVGEVRSARARDAVGVRAQSEAACGTGTRRAARSLPTSRRTPGIARSREIERACPRSCSRRRTSTVCTRAPAAARSSNCTATSRACAARATAASSTRWDEPPTRCRRAAAPAARSCGPTSSGSRRCCPRAHWRAAEDAARECDVLIVAGTSAEVYPAAALPDDGARSRRARRRGQSECDAALRLADDALRGPAGGCCPRSCAPRGRTGYRSSVERIHDAAACDDRCRGRSLAVDAKLVVVGQVVVVEIVQRVHRRRD